MANVDKKTMVLCGDSFNFGIGCRNLHTEPYGVLTAQHFGWDLIRLARGSASNYVIHLQGVYASKMNPKPHLVVIGTTSNDRVEWLAEGKELTEDPVLEDVNYHLYPPHFENPPLHDAPLDFYLKDDPKYDPKILSEQVVAFSDYMYHVKVSGGLVPYYKRFHNEPMEKLSLIEKYYFDIFDYKIKRDYDNGVLYKAYMTVKKAGIPCIVASQDFALKELIDERDWFYQDWGRCSRLWPDSVGSMHTGEGGHADTAERLIEFIKEKGFE